MSVLDSAFSVINYESIKTGVSSFGAQVMNDPLNVAGPVVFNIFKTLAVYNLYESALSDILCLKTFRHGTSPSAWLKIHLMGPDLQRGGTGGEAEFFRQKGAKSQYAARDKGRFYAVQDYFEKKGTQELDRIGKAFCYLDNRGTVKYYSLRSTVAYYASWMPLPTFIKEPILEVVISVLEDRDPRVRVFGLMTPTIKVHLDPGRVSYPNQSNVPSNVKHTFIADEYSDYKEDFSGACYTIDPISVTDIGICGVLKNGLNTRLFQRISENRGQFLFGLAQLVMAVALTTLVFPGAIPGAELALFFAAKPLELLVEIPMIGPVIAGIGFIASTTFVAAQF